MAKVYYIGDWAVQLGPVYAETSFNHAPKGLDFINFVFWEQYAQLWTNACDWLVG